MKKFTIRIDSDMSLNARIIDYLPKFNKDDIFDTEIEAYKMALTLSRAIHKKNNDVNIYIKTIEQ
jgi:hypothetical protein